MGHRSVALLALALLVPASNAGADTLCTMGSPTPGFKVIRLDLPQGSSYIGMELHGSRTTRPVEDGSSWHFARGLLLLDSSFDLVTYRIVNSGTSPKTYVVGLNGERIAVDAPGSDGAFIHSDMRLIPNLGPGVYYAVGFGVDGSSRNPNEYWTADIRVQGAVSCASVAVGNTFDLDHTAAHAGMQAHVPGAVGVADEAEFSYTSTRQVSVGLLDCSVQANLDVTDDLEAGDAECEVDLADGTSMEVQDAIVPFVTGPGTATVRFEHAGLAPVVSFAGASFTLTG